MAYMRDSGGVRLDGLPVAAKLALGVIPYTRPSGFTLSRKTFNVYKVGTRFVCDYDLDADRPPTGATYYASPTGLSGNDGLTAATATTLGTAIGKADVGTIVCILSPSPSAGAEAGEFFRSNTLGQIAKPVNIIAQSPGVKITGWEQPSTLTWTLESGNIYKCTRSSTQLVADKRAAYRDAVSGDYRVYTQVANLAAIVAAGQWAIVGSTVYVWALGDANLATDATFMRLSLAFAGSGIVTNASVTVYAENIAVEGAGSASLSGFGTSSSGTTGQGATFLARGCSSKYSLAAGGVSMVGSYFSALIDCEASTNVNDGFNYHSGSSVGGTIVPQFLEIDCKGHHNGVGHTTGAIDNGSTSHDGITGVRIGGDYYSNFGPNIADVTQAKTWNVGCRAALSTGGTVTRGWGVNVAGTALDTEAWFDECVVEDNAVGFESNAGIIHVRNATRRRNVLGVEATSSGTITTY